MASGFRQELLNARERVMSGDVNRLQKFAAGDIAEILDWMSMSLSQDDLESNGQSVLITTTQSPAFGLVVGGLMFRPTISSINAAIDPGLVMLVNPDAVVDPDDSPVKYIRDAGLASGTLTFTANISGSRRIDVVECQRTEAVVETAVRDVFDTLSGLFAPTSINKVTKSTLTYRIRNGVGGAGFPGTASGWMPLAVISVPSGGLGTWDDCTIWDVRPLLSDLARPHSRGNVDLASQTRTTMALTTKNTTTKLIPLGYCETQLGVWRAGGRFPYYSPGAANPGYIDLRTANYLEPGTAFAARKMYIVYLAQPFGLPRWVQYSNPNFGQLIPLGPRGLPILSVTIPNSMVGRPPGISPINLPTGFGFSGTTTNVVAIAAGYCDSISNVPWELGCDGRMQLPAVAFDSVAINPASVVGTQLNFTLTAGTHFPANARRVRLRLKEKIAFAAVAPVYFEAITKDDIGTVHFLTQTISSGPYKSTVTTETVQMEFEMPIEPTWADSLATVNHSLICDVTGGSPTPSAVLADHELRVVGWDMGP